MNHDTSPLQPSESKTDFMPVYIEVTTWQDFDDLYEEDQGALGSFKVCVPRHLSPSIAAAAAMGAFHSTIPIKYLDSFEYEVSDQNGRVIEPDYDADWYDLAEEHQAFLD